MPLPRCRPGRRRSRNRQGVVAVELALTLPIFLLFVLAIFEFGQAFEVQQLLTNAAREGARRGVLPGSTNTAVTQAVQDHVAAGNINGNLVNVTITPANLATATSGTQVTVEVRVNYDNISWLASPWFLNGATLSSRCVMRHE